LTSSLGVAASAAPPVSQTPLPPAVWAMVAGAIQDGNLSPPLPTTLPALLGEGNLTPPLGGWDAYFVALGKTPTTPERAALNSFALHEPALAAALGDLAAAEAQAMRLRDAAFATFSPDQMRALADAARAGGAGQDVSPQARALVSRVDLTLLQRAAAILDAAAARAQVQIPQALASDRASAAARSWPWDPQARDDPAAVLAALSHGAAPAAPRSLQAGLAALTGSAAPVPTLPANLDVALGTLLGALADAKTGAKGGDELAATAAVVLPALTRASYNLSLLPPGHIAALEGQPLVAPPGSSALDGLLADQLGASDAPLPNVTFVAALAMLHESLGQPWSADDAARATLAQDLLGPDLSAGLGSLIAAQARYQSDFAPGSPLSAAALRASQAAAPILARGGPLTTQDVATLDASSQAQQAWRANLSEDAALILHAAQALHQGTSKNAGPVPVYRDTDVVVLGTGDDTLTTADWPHAPMLLVDLGGNDTYDVPVAATNVSAADLTLGGSDPMTSVAVDLGGSDVYAAPGNRSLATATGVPGSPTLSFLLDQGGNDTYAEPGDGVAWARDGLAILLDAAGDDHFDVRDEGLGVANTTSISSVALAALVHLKGNVTYHASQGFARLEGTGGSPLTTAAFLEGFGDTTYQADCTNTAGSRACFATPRNGEGPNEQSPPTCVDLLGDQVPGQQQCGNVVYDRIGSPYTQGTAIFVDLEGDDTWPSTGHGQPYPSGDQPSVIPPSPAPPLPQFHEENVSDTSFRNIIVVANVVPSAASPDAVVAILGGAVSGAGNPSAGWPDLPSPLPQIPNLVPGGTGLPIAGAPNDHYLLDDWPWIKVGGPGTTRYDRQYLVTIDLGVSDADQYHNATAAPGVAIDVGGDDSYAPVAGASGSAESIAASGVPLARGASPLTAGLQNLPALLVDLGGNDRYTGNLRTEAFAAGSGSAILLDAAGNDQFIAGNLSQAYATGGSASLVKLTGAAVYKAPWQGVAAPEGSQILVSGGTPTVSSPNPAHAMFVDLSGATIYDRVGVATPPDALPSYQGAVTNRSTTGIDGWTNASSATFVDINGPDVFLVHGADGATYDVSRQKNDVFLSSADANGNPGGVATYLDINNPSPTADKNRDDIPDGAAVVVGSDPGSSSDEVYTGDTASPTGWLLDLPRLGVSVGSTASTLWTREGALQVDLGGSNTHLSRAGASSASFPVSLALDLGGGDVYAYNASTPLSGYTTNAVLGSDTSTLDGPLFVGGAQGAGVLGVGVLVNGGGGNVFSVYANATGGASVVGAAQGAGVLGVGILRVNGGGNRYEVQAGVEAPDVATASATTLSQGAALFGLGILDTSGAPAGDRFALSALSKGKSTTNSTAGQGFAMHGVGVLLEESGNNVFVASDHAQGATLGGGDVDQRGLLNEQSVEPALRAGASVGALLLSGSGADDLRADIMSQAYADAGLAILYKAEGPGTFTLTGPYRDVTTKEVSGGTSFTLTRPLHVALGQAAAVRGGFALLLSPHGDDRYVAAGQDAQAYGDGGTALLLDLSGADAYLATTRAQGYATDGEGWVAQAQGAGWPTAAALVDRRGNDDYELADDAPLAQGATSGPAAVAAGVSGTPPPVAAFVDAGGFDRYHGAHPLNQKVVNGASDGDRNDWSWQSGQGIGVDSDFPGLVMAQLLPVLQPVVGAQVRAEGANVTDAGVGSRNVTFAAWLGTAAGSATSLPVSAVDRVEFDVDHAPAGNGTLASTGEYTYLFDTAQRDPLGHLLFPDGLHEIEGYVYARTGTPEGGSSPAAAVDAEPFAASRSLPIDNAPRAAGVDLPAALSPALAPLRFRTWIDRDLETGACAACVGLPYLTPGPDLWTPVAQPDPWGAAAADTACNVPGCVPFVSAYSGAGNVYLNWSAPRQSFPPVVGYRLERVQDGIGTPLGYLDPRAPLRWVDVAPPGPNATYRVHALRIEGGVLAEAVGSAGKTDIRADLPRPVSGVRAEGTEGGIEVTWLAVPGATSYKITRTAPNGSTIQPGSTDAFLFDTTAEPDLPYTYAVIAQDAAGDAIASDAVSAQASPGENVTLQLVGPTVLTLLDRAPVGGNQILDVPLDLRGSPIPDGQYLLKLDEVDHAGHQNASQQVVTMDGTPPVTLTPLPLLVPDSFSTGGLLRIPFEARDAGSGAATTTAFEQIDGAWTHVTVPSWQGYVDVRQPGDGTPFKLLLLSRDYSGNVEGLRTPRPYAPDVVTDGFLDAIATRTLPTRVMDTVAPQVTPLTDIDVHVAPGTPIPIKVAAVDRGTGVARIVAQAGPDQVSLSNLGDGLWGGSLVPTGNAREQITLTAWDAAGNQAQPLKIGDVDVDGEPPVILAAALRFGADARTLAHPGDLGSLRVDALDNLSDPGSLTVLADVGNLSSMGAVSLRWNGASYVANEIPIDRATAAGVANYSVRVTDAAGNFATLALNATLSLARTSVSDPVVTTPRADTAVVSWTTNLTTWGRVLYGLSPQLGQQTAQDAGGASHAVNLTGLLPDSDYFARAVSKTQGGIETLSNVTAFHTPPALVVNASIPATNVLNRTRVDAVVARFDGAPVSGELQAVLAGPRGSPEVVGAGAFDHGAGTLVAQLGTFRDGDYNLTLIATDAEGETATSAPVPVRIDATPPQLLMRPRANVAPGAALGLDVEESGSGVDFANVSWTFADVPCAAMLVGNTLSCVVPSLPTGPAQVEIRVPDRAGNLGRIAFTLDVAALDASAIRASLHGPRDAPHVAPGGTATLSVDVPGQVRRVVANLSALGGAEARLHATGARAYGLDVPVPSDAQPGPIDITVLVEDLGGNQVTLHASGIVDATPAATTALDVTPLTYSRVSVRVATTVPTRSQVQLGQGAPSADAAWSTLHSMELSVPPGANFTAMLTLTDQAGRLVTLPVAGAPVPDLQPPAPVAGLRWQDFGDGNVRLSWSSGQDNVSGIAGYAVVRTLGDVRAPVRTVVETSLDDSIPPGVEATYQVAALDRAGNEGAPAAIVVRSTPLAHLSEGRVDPPLGGPGFFRFLVHVDADPGATPRVEVVVDGAPHALAPEPGCMRACNWSALVEMGPQTLAGQAHSYAFRATSGQASTALPATGALEGPTVLADAKAPSFAGLVGISRVPLFGAAGLGLVLAAAVTIYAIARRKRQ
jgi:hypothetical protein